MARFILHGLVRLTMFHMTRRLTCWTFAGGGSCFGHTVLIVFKCTFAAYWGGEYIAVKTTKLESNELVNFKQT